MANITLKKAMELVAPRVGMDVRTNRDELMFLIDRAQEAAYNKGVWWGMYKQIDIQTCDNEIYLPYPYTELISINLSGRPQLKRGVHYQFHQNGYGSIEDCYSSCKGSWIEDVVDMGESPVPFQPGGHNLQVRCHTAEKGTENITISGQGFDGPIYTYFYDKAEADEKNIIGKEIDSCLICSSTDESDKISYTKTSYGEVVPLRGSDKIIETGNKFVTIDSITKGPTLGPVDLFVAHGDSADIMLTLAPEQTESVFRRFMLPESCNNKRSVTVLAKLGEPSPVSHDQQPLMIKSSMALVYLCLSMHYEFNKMDPTNALIYLERGIIALDEQNATKTGHDVQPIQVVTPETDAYPLYGFR